MEFMQSISSDCDKLVKLSAKPNFREADFMSVVKDLVGEEGVVQCRALLDGGNNSSGSSDYLQQVISEGRCVVCNHSTFEDDIQEKAAGRQSTGGAGGDEEDAPTEEVILCDGCNAEAHLRCLNLSSVPTTEWHCGACKDRIALRESKHSSVLVEGGGSIDKHRSKIIEEDLLNSVIDKRVNMVTSTGTKGSSGKNSNSNSTSKEEVSGSSASLSAMEPAPGEDKCLYCGMGELELCSPFVVGQSREEHEAVLALAGRKPTADHFFGEGVSGTTVLFLNQGKTLAPPVVEFPFFPPVKSPKGEHLLAEHRECGGHCVPVIAHQLCALQIFQARVTRSRHTLRRRNKVVGQRAVSMTGISILPLGYDDSGREYWKFPTSDDLFICITTNSNTDTNNTSAATTTTTTTTTTSGTTYVDQCRAEFTALLAAERVSYDTSNSDSMDVDQDIAAVTSAAPTATTSATPTKVWKRLCEVQDIRRIVELLGGSEGESGLKKSIINALLLERSVAAAAANGSADTADVKTEVKPETDDTTTDPITTTTNNTNNTTTTTNTTAMNTWLDRSRSSNSLENAKNPDSYAGEENKTLKKGVDIVPTSMRLMTGKGQDIMPNYVIQNEVVFEEEVTEEGEDEEERVNEYFTFNKGRKYFAIALLNKEGSVLKMGGTTKQQNLTVVYQIHRDGISAPLSYAPLSEAWTDHMYYFSTVQFKRSGKYTLSFIVEGDNAGSIRPLIFPVTVTSSSVRCGIPHAIDRLEGVSYIDSASRHVVVGRKEIVSSIECVYSEIDAVRAALLIVYLALPAGALSSDTSTTSTSSDAFGMITEPAGWNDVLDQAWRGAVYSATTPLQLIECVLLLEYYINKQWLAYPHNRLLSALPSPHFAVCGATYSSTALRVYCLDKALLYDKVFVPPRERRAAQFDQYAYEETTTSNTRNTTTTTYERTKRTAATNATLRIQKSVNYNDGSDSEGEAPPATTLAPQRWTCVECTVVNEARARSCVSCEARKPAPGSVSVSSGRVGRGGNSGVSGGSSGGREERGRASGRAAAANSRAKTRRVVDSDNSGSDQDSAESDSDNSNVSGGSNGSNGSGGSGGSGGGKKASGSEVSSNDSSSESGTDNSLVNSDAESPRANRRASTSTSNKRTTNTSSDRKSSRARNSVGSYYNESDEEEFEPNNKVKGSNSYTSSTNNTSTGGKRRREDSVDNTTSTSKRTRELTPDEHSALYRRDLPNKIALYTTLINNATTTTTNTTDSTVRYLSILRALQQDESTEPFWEPVDTKAVPSYKHYIAHPMDLGTIRDKVVKGVYRSVDQFAQDVRLVWSNCKTFNMEFSTFYVLASTLSKKFESLLQRWVLDESNRPANPDIHQQ